MPMPMNLFTQLPDATQAEVFETLLQHAAMKIERIVSQGQATPDGQWYDQAEHEWILVLQGEAQLEWEGEAALMHLKAGDSVNIPAHVRHRVAWTPADQTTIWLAVFYS